jgi:hypothetical protein
MSETAALHSLISVSKDDPKLRRLCELKGVADGTASKEEKGEWLRNSWGPEWPCREKDRPPIGRPSKTAVTSLPPLLAGSALSVLCEHFQLHARVRAHK